MKLFSDDGKGLRLAAAAFLLLGLGGFYAWWAANAESGWRWAMEDPRGRHGAIMVFPLWTVTRIVDDTHYEISKVISDVPVFGNAADLRVGATVSVSGHFDSSVPTVVVDIRELHTLRKYKEVLGVLGFVTVLLWIPFAFRVVDRRLVERG